MEQRSMHLVIATLKDEGRRGIIPLRVSFDVGERAVLVSRVDDIDGVLGGFGGARIQLFHDRW